MDPTIEMLTIYPAAWAALFQGLAEGLIYDLVGMATAAIVATVLIVTLDSLRDCCRTDEPLTDLSQPVPDELPAIVQLAVVRQQRQRRRGRTA